MKNIRLFWNMLCFALTALSVLPTSFVRAQVQAQHQVDGKVSIRIESKTLTLQEAQAHLQRKDSIPLMVSLVFEGQWVDYFDQNFLVYMNQSSFSYGIATAAGSTYVDAPLYSTGDVPAAMLARITLGCTMDDGTPLNVPYVQSNSYIVGPLWNDFDCPKFGYGCGFSSSSNMQPRKETIDGKTCYVVDLFSVGFKLKRLETVYVRGIDDQGTYVTENDKNFDATAGTTEININNIASTSPIYWPGSPSTTAADWTQAPKEYYGGIIPGGIFIEQSPEVAQFEPCLTGVSGLKFKA